MRASANICSTVNTSNVSRSVWVNSFTDNATHFRDESYQAINGSGADK